MNLHARAAVIGDDAFVMERPQALGKFLFACGEKLWVRGVTYGTFQPDSFGIQFPAPDVAAADFGAMARAGLNAVRVYTPPPLWMLTLAASHGLRLMIGLPWEQHVSFLDDPADRARIVDEMRASI